MKLRQFRGERYDASLIGVVEVLIANSRILANVIFFNICLGKAELNLVDTSSC